MLTLHTMKRMAELILMVFLLGAFIFPNQMVFAQPTEQCCSVNTTDSGCCDTGKNSCHSSTEKNQNHNSCEGNCSCAMGCHTGFSFSAESYDPVILDLNSPSDGRGIPGYASSFIFSVFQNIWQPPKIA